jgi:hypothetical protein
MTRQSLTSAVHTHHSPEACAVSPPVQVSHGGGGSMPGWCGSPAEMGAASAHTSAREARSFFKVVSPLVEVVDGDARARAVTAHYTRSQDPDVILFCELTGAQNFDGAIQLCRERLLTTRDEAAARRWTKDRSIVESLRGNFTAAYDLLASVHWLALRAEGTPRGKYETEFGIVHARLGRSSLALEHFNIGFQHHRKDGGELPCAEVDTARARCLVTRGELLKAHRYLNRASSVALSYSDTHLQSQIEESRALAYEAEERFVEAEASAFHSVQLMRRTGDGAGQEESVRTWMRLRAKLMEVTR